MASDRWKRTLWGLAIGSLAIAASPCRAAGGAHVVDDAFVETPGLCHTETWATASGGGSLLHGGLGCTREAIPTIEFGVAIDRTKDNDGGATTVSPALKYTLVAHPGGFGVALDLGTAIDTRHGRVKSASLVVPISITLGRYAILNFNAGLQVDPHPGNGPAVESIWGGQIDYNLAPHVTLMAELFDTGARTPGTQAGLRWSPGPERVDIDLLASCGPGAAPAAFTLGVTARF